MQSGAVQVGNTRDTDPFKKNTDTKQADKEINQPVSNLENMTASNTKIIEWEENPCHFEKWKMISSDSRILELVYGYSVELIQGRKLKPSNFNDTNLEIMTLKSRTFNQRKSSKRDKFKSGIVIELKKNGKIRDSEL